MGHKALYREWRPRTFDEIVEQHHVVVSLRQAVRTGHVAHAYLFSGTRGTGKTTMAQIMSRAINCLDPKDGNPCNACAICKGILDGSLLDVIEMDAASNNSVETIRRICDEVVFSPSQARFKVYIIDEAHMLSTGAFNALLKTLEEPPSFAVFILATTEPHRLPATILSRCQRYDFRRIPTESIVTRLEEVGAASGIPVDRDAYFAIAALSDGAMRDAISLLDQCLSSAPERVTKDDVLELAGIVNDAFMGDMAEALAVGDAGAILHLVDRLIMDGRDVVRFASDLAVHFRNIMVCRTTADPSSLVRLPDAALTRMQALAQRMELADVLSILRGLSSLLSDLKWAPDPRTTFEVALIRLMPASTLPVSAQARPAAPVPAVRAAAPAPVTPAAPAPVKAPVQVPVAAPIVALVEDDPPFPEEEDVPPPPEDDGPPPVTQTVPAPVAQPAAKPMTIAVAVESVPAPASAAPSQASADARTVWIKALTDLQDNSQMVLYLFLREGVPSLDGNRFTVRFLAAAAGHREEIERKENLKTVRMALSAASGRDLELVYDFAREESTPGTSGAQGAAKDNWVDKVRDAAQSNGIPFRVEE
jgi:DNA polymerase III subunit gamma/tau